MHEQMGEGVVASSTGLNNVHPPGLDEYRPGLKVQLPSLAPTSKLWGFLTVWGLDGDLLDHRNHHAVDTDDLCNYIYSHV